jgi:hypothetical protein
MEAVIEAENTHIHTEYGWNDIKICISNKKKLPKLIKQLKYACKNGWNEKATALASKKW